MSDLNVDEYDKEETGKTTKGLEVSGLYCVVDEYDKEETRKTKKGLVCTVCTGLHCVVVALSSLSL